MMAATAVGTFFVTRWWVIRYINLTVYSDMGVLNGKVDMVYAASSLHCDVDSYVCSDTVRVLCLGNSLTLFPQDESIGWYCSRGMAASRLENDYVHVLERRLNSRPNISNATVKPVDIRAWEYDFSTDKESLFGDYLLDSDIIVIRIGENVPKHHMPDFNVALDDLVTIKK